MKKMKLLLLPAAVLMLGIVSCPMEVNEYDGSMGPPYRFEPLKSLVLHEDFKNFKTGALDMDYNGESFGNQHAVFFSRFNIYNINSPVTGRIDIVEEGAGKALRLHNLQGTRSSQRTDFAVSLTSDAFSAMSGKNTLLQFRLRAQTPLLSSSSINAANVFMSRMTGVNLTPPGNRLIEARIATNGYYQVQHNNFWESYAIKPGVWHSVEMMFDFNTDKYQVYIDGEQAFEHYFYQRAGTPSFGCFCFYNQSYNASLFISDIRISTEADTGVFTPAPNISSGSGRQQ